MNRATGHCVCESDAALVATPVGATSQSQPQAQVEAPRWAPLDAGAGRPPAPATSPQAAGWDEGWADVWRPSAAGVMTGGFPPPRQDSWLAAIPRVRIRRRDYDLFVFEDQVVATKLKSAHAVSVGVLAGGWIGQFVGQKVEGSRSRDRIEATRGVAAEELARRPKSIVLSQAAVTRVEAKSRTGGGRIRIHAAAKPLRLSWKRGYVSDFDVERALARGFGNRLTFRARTTSSRVLAWTGLALLALLTVAYTLFNVLQWVGVVTLNDEPRFSGEFVHGCEAWAQLGQDIPNLGHEERAARLAHVRSHFETATPTDAPAAGAAQGVLQVEQWFAEAAAATSPEAMPPIATVQDAATRVDRACGAQ